MKLVDCESHEERITLLEKTAIAFFARARKHDEKGTFPHENFEDLKRIGYPSLTVPKKYGGAEISLEELLAFQETIAKQDGSTALAIGWHMGITMNEGENRHWQGKNYEIFAKDVVETGALINSVATEPATGSPTRGGKPETAVKETESGWVLNGRKTFATLSPVLDYFIISATIDGKDKVARFLVRRHLKGVTVDETWDSVAMKATGSHDVVLENVSLGKGDLLEYEGGGRDAQGWLLHVPACYLGIAEAAKDYAVEFATSYSPNSITGTISEIPTVQQKIGRMAFLSFQAHTVLYALARKWDQAEAETRNGMKLELGAVKVSVMEKVIEIVDTAMRIVGARSLSATCPLQRYYRDIRAGLHNPPMDDMVIAQLAKQEIER